jgi:hypothetical protein
MGGLKLYEGDENDTLPPIMHHPFPPHGSFSYNFLPSRPLSALQLGPLGERPIL